MPVAAVTAIVGAYSAYQQHKANQQGRDAQNQATQNGVNAYEQGRADLQPYADFGKGAIPLLQQLNSGNFSGFENSPDFLFAKQQMTQGVDRSAASRGSLFSGGHEVDLAQRLGGLASQQLGAYRNSLFDQLGAGQNAATNQGNFAGGLAGLYGQQGANNANYAQRNADTNSQFAAGLGGLFANYAGGNMTGSSYAAPAQTGSPFSPQYAATYNQSIFGNRT
jgi:hypothetical protein